MAKTKLQIWVDEDLVDRLKKQAIRLSWESGKQVGYTDLLRQTLARCVAEWEAEDDRVQ